MSERFNTQEAGINLTALALRHRELSWFFIVVVAVAGVMSYLQLQQREDPDFTFRAMTIQTQWPGATAQQVDLQITERIEEKLQETPYLKATSGYSRSGESIIMLELVDSSPGKKIQEHWYQVRKKVDDIRHTLPAGVIGPFFNDEFGDVFGSIYAFSGEGFALEELRRLLEAARKQLLKLPDVAKVDLIGVQPERINIVLSHYRLAKLGLPPLAVAQAIQAQNITQDAGHIDAADFAVPLRVTGNFTSIEQLADLPLRINERTVRLADVADIHRDYLDPPVTLFRHEGKPALALAISMKEQGDVLRLGEGLQREIEAIKKTLPAGVNVTRVSDQPAIVKKAVSEFMLAFLEAVVIVLVMSFIVLGLRAGLVVAITIPLVLAGTFALMNVFGIDLQRISTGALIIALGLLVDDAMIIIEMMARKLEEGFDRMRAATFAYTATAIPMLTGTLITVAGFLPIGTAKSGTGEYTFAMFAVTALALLVSWLAAVFVTPLAGYYILKAHPGQAHDVFDTRFYRVLRKIIDMCLTYRKTVIVFTASAFVLGAVGMGMTEKQFFPSSNRTEIMVELWLPEGSSIAATQRTTERFETFLANQEEIKTYVSYVGNSSPRFFLSLYQQLFRPNYAQIVVLTEGVEERERVVAYLNRVANEQFFDIRTRVLRVPLGPPINYPVEFRLLGNDVDELKKYADQVMHVMRADKRMYNVHADWGDMVPALRIEVDQDRARALDVSSTDIARTLAMVNIGVPVAQYQENTRLIDITLRAPALEASRLDEVANINIPTRNGGSVMLSEVATITSLMEEPIYWRRNQELMLNVRADIIDGVQAPDVAMQLEKPFAEVRAQMAPGYRIEVGGSLGESASAQASINAGMPLMFAVILSVLMLQLKSISRTILVLLTAPLGIIGVASALLLFNQPFGFVAMLGTIALSGMIMRNTVILVDQIRQDLESGLPAWEAIRESTVRRFRPIVLTAFAAILAMIPLTNSILWGPMAFALMGGLFIATILTILFVPALYAAWFRVKRA